MADKTNRRNEHGVKASIDMYRTIGGAHFISWGSFMTDERIAAYRAAGIRCARRGVELFIHHADEEAAKAVDANSEA